MHTLTPPPELENLQGQITALRTTIADAARLSDDAERQRVQLESDYQKQVADALVNGAAIPARPAALERSVQRDDALDGATLLLAERLRALETAHTVQRQAWLESSLNAALASDAAKAHDAAQRLAAAATDLALFSGGNAAADALESLVPVVRSQYAGQFRARFAAWDGLGHGSLVAHLTRENAHQFPSGATVAALLAATITPKE